MAPGLDVKLRVSENSLNTPHPSQNSQKKKSPGINTKYRINAGVYF